MPKRSGDHTDLHILNILQREGDITFKDLSKRVGLSVTAVFNRVGHLRKMGLLSDAFCELNKTALGYEEQYFLKVSVADKTDQVAKLEELLLKDSLVETVHALPADAMIGNVQYRVLIRVKNAEHLKKWSSDFSAKGSHSIVETEPVKKALKTRSALKLTFNDLRALKGLDK